jgi:hypothetical protein
MSHLLNDYEDKYVWFCLICFHFDLQEVNMKAADSCGSIIYFDIRSYSAHGAIKSVDVGPSPRRESWKWLGQGAGPKTRRNFE